MSGEESESISIDGYLNESAWESVPFTNESEFVDIAQGIYRESEWNVTIPPLNHSTRVKVRWDREYLYIGAILNEPFIMGMSHQEITDPPRPILTTILRYLWMHLGHVTGTRSLK